MVTAATPAVQLNVLKKRGRMSVAFVPVIGSGANVLLSAQVNSVRLCARVVRKQVDVAYAQRLG